MNFKKSIVISKLPDAGLGNKLFTWGHGVVFAHKNGLEHYSIGWTKINIGPILRRETSFRFYRNYFKSTNLLSKIMFLFLKLTKNSVKQSYSNCQKIEIKHDNNIFIFYEVPHWNEFFKGLRENQELIVNTFFKSLRPNIHNDYLNKKNPIIGVHIRMGDFRKLSSTEDFSKVGQTRTPMQYFIDVINNIRKISGKELPVSIFSDGRIDELSDILSLKNVDLVQGNKDIIDLILLSKSKIIVTSAGSTFSYWAGFLSKAALIRHPDHIHEIIRDEDFNSTYYEGPFSDSVILVQNILSI